VGSRRRVEETRKGEKREEGGGKRGGGQVRASERRKQGGMGTRDELVLRRCGVWSVDCRIGVSEKREASKRVRWEI